MAKRAKSRFMVIMFHGDGEYTTIDCVADNTEGAIKETRDEIPDGQRFMVVQVKREGLFYGVDSRRVLMGATDHRMGPSKQFTAEPTKENTNVL